MSAIKLLLQRKNTGKDTSFASLAADLQFGIMAQQNMFDDGQSQASATGAAIAAGVYTIKTLGQAGNMFLLNTGAVIADRKIHILTIAPQAHNNPALVRRVL